jgi:hypothetical protein
MHKLGGEGKAQGGEGAAYSQGVEPQAYRTSLILGDFFQSVLPSGRRRMHGLAYFDQLMVYVPSGDGI